MREGERERGATKESGQGNAGESEQENAGERARVSTIWRDRARERERK